MFCEDIVDKNIEWSNDQATVVIRINADQWKLTSTQYSNHSLIAVLTTSSVVYASTFSGLGTVKTFIQDSKIMKFQDIFRTSKPHIHAKIVSQTDTKIQ